MRNGYALIAGSLVVVWAVGSASSQVPKQSTTVSPPAPTAVRDLRVRPTTDGVRLSIPVTTLQALTADECKALGGKVEDDPFNVCTSKKLCKTTDNRGEVHQVCLTAN